MGVSFFLTALAGTLVGALVLAKSLATQQQQPGKKGRVKNEESQKAGYSEIEGGEPSKIDRAMKDIRDLVVQQSARLQSLEFDIRGLGNKLPCSSESSSIVEQMSMTSSSRATSNKKKDVK